MLTSDSLSQQQNPAVPAAPKVWLWDRPLPLPARRGKPVMVTVWLAIAGVLGALAVLLLPSPLNVVAPLAPVAAAFLLRQPLVALYALTFSVPFGAVRSFSVAGLQVTSTEAVIALLFMTWCTDAALRGRFALPPTLPWGRALLVLGGAMVLSISQASELVLSLKEMLKWMEMLIVYLLALLMMQSARDVPRLFMMLVLAGIAEAAVGLAQVFAHGGGVFHAAGVLRAAGSFDQPNPFAGFLNMSLPLVVAALLLGLPHQRRLMSAAVVITSIAVLVSLSRGAWLAILTGVATMVWMALPQWRRWIVAGLVVLVVLIGASLAGILPAQAADTLAALFSLNQVDVVNPTPATWSAAERLAHWQAGLAMFYAHPILGVGIGNYPSAYAAYQVAPVWTNPLGHAHDYYINIAAEAGIIGLAAYLFFLASTIGLCIRQWRTATTQWGRVIGLGTVGVLVTMSVHNLFDNLYVQDMQVQLALIMVLVALAGRYDSQLDESTSQIPWPGQRISGG